jgi:hypothetical protein
MRRPLVAGLTLLLGAALVLWIVSAFAGPEKPAPKHLALMPAAPTQRLSSTSSDTSLLPREQRAVERARREMSSD